jgi:hypothetical protein
MPKFCHSCGAALVDHAAFCSECGTGLKTDEPSVLQSPARSAMQQVFTPVRPSTPIANELDIWDRVRLGSRKVIGFVFGAFLVLVILVLIIKQFAPSGDVAARGPHQDLLNSVPTPESSGTATAPPAQKRVTHRIGEEFSIGYWSYRCNGAQWQSMIAGLGRAETPDAEFLVVDLYIRNNDRTASTLPLLKLIDEQGREFDESSKGTFMPGAFDMLKQLNPGVSSQGYAVFDAPHGQYSLEVSGGFESGEHALIDLSPKPQSYDSDGQSSSPPVQTEVAPMLANNTGASSTSSANAVGDQVQPLQLEAGVRMIVHVVNINHQPDGKFTFLGRLSRPVPLSGGGSIDQGTKLWSAPQN